MPSLLLHSLLCKPEDSAINIGLDTGVLQQQDKVSPGLFLSTETPVMTPSRVDLCFSSQQ